MAIKKPKRLSLGKNFNVLLGQIQTIQAVSQGKKSTEDLKRLPVEYLSSGQYQPRKDFPPESLQELANSIRSQGIIQPIIVRSIGERHYEIIAGERRWRAAQRINRGRAGSCAGENRACAESSGLSPNR